MVSDASVFKMFSATLLPGSMPASSWIYAAFIGVVLLLLMLDLGVFHRSAQAPSMRESLAWTLGWITLALVFSGVVYVLYDRGWGGLGVAAPVFGSPDETVHIGGMQAVRLYVTAYLVEKSLSMDNLFVIAMIFSAFSIPASLQHRVLYWGVLGALISRGVMIGAGAALVARFWWVGYVFGAILIVSALKMMLAGEGGPDIAHGRVARLVTRFVPVSEHFDGQRLFTHADGRWCATPLLLAMLVIEASDVLFAVDSIPAVFAVTGDPFIVFTSNIMAVLGLRSLYFCLASAVLQFRYLKPAIVAVLLFVGIKVCLVHTAWKIPAGISTGVILGLLLSGLAASMVVRRGDAEPGPRVEGVGGEPAGPWESAGPAGPAPVRGTMRGLWRSNRMLRRLVVLSLGSTILAVGLVISPLPGPGLTVLGPLGIGILASEFFWARRLAARGVAHELRVRRLVDRVAVRVSRLYMVPLIVILWLTAWLLSDGAGLAFWWLWVLGVPLITPLCYVLFRWHRVRGTRKRDD